MKPALGGLSSDADFADRSGRSSSSSSSEAASQEFCSEDDFLPSSCSVSFSSSSDMDEDTANSDSEIIAQSSDSEIIAQNSDSKIIVQIPLTQVPISLSPDVSDEEDEIFVEGETLTLFCIAEELMPTKGCSAFNLTCQNYNLQEVCYNYTSCEDNTVTNDCFHPNPIHCTQMTGAGMNGDDSFLSEFR